MDARVKFLDREGFAAQVIYPTIGLLWEDAVAAPALAGALCRAYNTWTLELCASPGSDATLYSSGPRRTMARVSATRSGLPLKTLDIAIGLHLVGHAHYLGGEFFRGRDPGFIWMTMNVISHLVEAANYRRAEARGAGHQLRPALPHS